MFHEAILLDLKAVVSPLRGRRHVEVVRNNRLARSASTCLERRGKFENIAAVIEVHTLKPFCFQNVFHYSRAFN